MGQQKGSIELNNVLFGQKTFYSTQQNTTPSASELDDVIDGVKKIDVEASGEKLNVGIDTDGAQQGEVLTADGQGGVGWAPGGGGGSASWGHIAGTITNQTDLVNYVAEHGFTPTFIQASGSKTVNGYSVPQFTDDEIQEIYNAVVAGKPVVIVDEDETMFFTGVNADVVSEDVFISFRYFDKMILEYGESNVTNFSVIDNNIVSYYNPTNTYDTGDIIAHGARIYIAIADNITGDWDSSKWAETDLQAIITAIKAQIAAIGNIGKYLAIWDCTTGKPTTNPGTLPFAYTTGDYYIIGTVGTTNYMPEGTSYTGAASTTVDSDSPAVLDMYRFDGNVWTQLKFGEQFRAMLVNYYTKTEANNTFAAKTSVLPKETVTCYDEDGVAHTYEINMQEVV